MTSETEDSIQTILRNDHQRIRGLLEEIVALASEQDPHDFRETWKTFELDLLTHMHAEEVHVFRAFRHAEPAETKRLMDEHERIRDHLTEVAIALDLHSLRADQVSALAEEVRAHAAREDAVVYPWAARELGKVVQAQIIQALAARHGQRLAAWTQTWRIDPRRSTLTFALRHALVGEINGRFASWGGTLSVDTVQPMASGAFVWVDLASIETGDAARDAQARDAEFFDVERFPQARFVTQQIRLSDGANPIVEGRLNLHGVERYVALEIAGRRDAAGADGSERAIYTVKGRLDRRDFGLRWNKELDLRGIAVGAHVEIEAQVEVVLQKTESRRIP
ncbi:MAG TPA: YceI family protein [Polyangia bacterium]|nr:YceI family protein [Polyangia bacterium]